MRTMQRLLLLPSLLFFALLPAVEASITGAVIDSDGKALAGARVSMYAQETLDARRLRLQSKTIERVALATTQSDAKGNFTLESPKEPVVDVRIEAAGFAPDATRSLADDDLGAIALVRAPMIKGTITSGGKPVAGATVWWAGTAAEVVALTDAQGTYSVPDPAKWALRLTVIHPDFAILDENIIPNNPKKGADRVLNAGVPISGRVTAEDGQTPVAGAAILVDNWRLATTGEDGSFTVAHAMKDWAQVEAQAGEKAGARARSSSTAVAIRLAKGASVSGSVVDLKTQLPIAGVEVRLNTNTAGLGAMAVSSSRMAFTDAKGRFVLKPVVPGIYALSGSRPAATVTGSTISLSAAQSISRPLYLTARGRISGSVIDEDKRPLGGARVSFRAATSDTGAFVMGPRFNGPAAGFSAPDGHFVLRSVPTEMELRVDANRKGYPAAHTSGIRLNPGERKSGVLITIPHGMSLSGKVTDHDGKPLSGVAVDAFEAAGDGPGGGMRRMIMFRGQERNDDSIRSASDGTFLLKVKEGTYDVVLKREGFAMKNVRGVVVSPTLKPLEVTMDPGVEVSGRVTRGGTGVEGVNVGVAGSGGFSNSVTQSDGSFVVTDLSPGQAMLSVNKPDAFVQQMRPVTIPARDLTIELPQGGRITGRVVDKASKHPVTSFQAGVTTSRSGGGMVFMSPPMLKAFTSDDGSFTLENVPPGSTELVVNAPGYTTGRVPALNVEDGKTLADVEVAVETGVTLIGRVTGPDGSALAGVEVTQDQSSGRRVMRFDNRNSGAVTDPKGEYVLEALEPGEKTFSFSHQGLISQNRTVELSGDKVTLNVQLSAGMRVSGVVVNEGGSPIADAMVEASSATDDSFGRQARSDSSGNFQLEGLVGGHYTLSASKTGFAGAIQRDVDLSSGAPLRLVLTAGGTLSGHVTGLTDKELAQTTVSAQSPTGSASAAVDAAGSFHIEGAPIGTVRVSARVGEGMSGIKISPPKTVQVEAGVPTQVDLEFKSGTVIRGRVTRNGQVFSNAIVMFMPKAGRSAGLANATTDGSGQYELAGLDDGPYSVRVSEMMRTSPFTTSYDVHGSGTFDIDIKTSAVRGRVLDSSTGAAITDAHVEIRATGGDSMLSMRGAQTDSAGSFLLDDVARGTYEAIATKEGYGHQSLPLTVADSAEPLDFKLSPGSGITLRVVDQRDQRPIGATAKVTDAQGREVPVGDLFRFSGGTEPLKLTLAPGSYRVTVSAPGYASRTTTMSAPSDQTVGLSPGGSLILQARGSVAVRARLIDASGSPYMPGNRGPFGSPIFTIEPSPASTTLQNIAPGNYRLEILDAADQPSRSIDITVTEGQPARYPV